MSCRNFSLRITILFLFLLGKFLDQSQSEIQNYVMSLYDRVSSHFLDQSQSKIQNYVMVAVDVTIW